MARIQVIALSNPGPVVDTFIEIHYRASEFEWDISHIEIYSDIERTKLLCDLTIEELTRDAQESIYAAISAERDRQSRRRGARVLMRDLETESRV